MDYDNFRIHGCPRSAMYIPNFIASEEEQQILAQIEKTPKPKWTQLSRRRLINYGGIPHPNGMIAEQIPKWLQQIIERIDNLGIFENKKPNHVLINEYLPGQGIMPHGDGPLFHPVISTISCGSHTVLEFSDNIDKRSDSLQDSAIIRANNEDELEAGSTIHSKFKLMIEPRSLLILQDSLYADYMHSISERTEDVICDKICNLHNCGETFKYGDTLKRGTRISLTIRHVPKTSKARIKLGL